MPEKTLPTLVAGLYAAVFSGFMQLFILTLLSFKMAPLRYLAAFGVSTIAGGAITVILIEARHVNPFVAGSIAALLGALPAIFIPFIIMKKAVDRLGINLEDTGKWVDSVREIVELGEKDG